MPVLFAYWVVPTLIYICAPSSVLVDVTHSRNSTFLVRRMGAQMQIQRAEMYLMLYIVFVPVDAVRGGPAGRMTGARMTCVKPYEG